MKSEIGKLNLKDLVKGFILSIISALIASIYQAIQTKIEFTWVFWQPIIFTAIGSGLAYLLKNWLTNSNDEFLTYESKKYN